MCGIGGIVSFGGPQNGIPEKLQAINHAQQHRGPDGEGFVLFEEHEALPAFGNKTPKELKSLGGFLAIDQATSSYSGGLCHQRLSIIDLSIGGHQPITNLAGTVWLTYNGEIYNYRELRKQLSADGFSFYSESDAEVLLACWQAYGSRMSEYLDGMWAFALIDLEKQVFHASRDRIGVKPFYYHFSNKTLVFASEVKGLQAAGVQLKSNQESVANFLVYGSTPQAPGTFYQNVFLLEPGHTLSAKLHEGTLQKQCYYKPQFSPKLGTYSENMANELAAEVRSLLLTGVKSRLTSDVQVGICLSGGLDSSAILGSVNHWLRRENLPMIGDRPHAFSVVFPGYPEDESEMATSMATLANAHHHLILPNAEGFASQVEDLAFTMEMPFKGSNSYSAYKLYEKIAAQNIKVTMDGQGADELFGGYKRFSQVIIRQMLIEKRPLLWWKELEASGFKNREPHAWWLSQLKHLTHHWSVQQRFMEWKKPHLAFVNNEIRTLAFEKHHETCENNLNLALQDAMLGHELGYMLLASDKLAMRFGVESRVPFSDYLPLIEKVGDIPAVYKWRKGRNKYLLYEATKDLVAQKIYLNREKKGFSTPFGAWLGATHNQWSTYFTNDMNEYVDVVGLKKSWPKLLSSIQNQPEILWRIISLSLWKKVYKL